MLKIWSGIGLVAIILVFGSFLLPNSIDMTVSVPGKVMPIREWRLIQMEDGALRATLQDHRRGTVDAYTINRFERGDAIRFSMHPSILDRRYLSRGDTIGTLHSSETAIRLTDLQGELAARQASLQLYTSGEKPALIEEARQNILRAQSRADEHRKVLERQRQLYEQHLIAQEELEAAESLQKVYDADVAIAQAQLQARETGARQEQIDLTRTEVRALQASIDALKERLQFQTLIAPMNGSIARTFATDTLLTLRDTTGFLVLMPVPLKNQALLSPGAGVNLTLPSTANTLNGVLVEVGDTIHRINGEQVVPAIAQFQGQHPQILPGMLVSASIQCGEISLGAYLKHQLN